MKEHCHPINRRLHVIGTCLGFSSLVFFAFYDPRFIPFSLIVAYGMAWTGHFVFEKNKPATFKHPFQSFKADLKLTWLTLSQPFRKS